MATLGLRGGCLTALRLSAGTTMPIKNLSGHRLSSGFWEEDTGRYAWRDLVGFKFWADILLRLAVRHFSIFGIVFLLVGLLRHDEGFPKAWFGVGMVSVLLTVWIAPTRAYVQRVLSTAAA